MKAITTAALGTATLSVLPAMAEEGKNSHRPLAIQKHAMQVFENEKLREFVLNENGQLCRGEICLEDLNQLESTGTHSPARGTFQSEKPRTIDESLELGLGSNFVKAQDGSLRIRGQDFRFAGSNNYYLAYKSQAMADHVIEDAVEQGFNVLRAWGSFETGNLDGSNSTYGKADGAVYFQYWDPATGAPAYNDGASGLERLDYVVFKAKQSGLRLILPLVNNWPDFGGMDQYVAWAGGQHHDDFYTNPQIKAWYKNWVSHLLNRVNTFTGVKYKDEHTIMMWELANEPRCRNYGQYPDSGNCTSSTIVSWADEMSQHIDTITNHQLISAGDEGFFCRTNATDWLYQCPDGVDTEALAALPKIDAMSVHLYPDHWGVDANWGRQWIKDHAVAAKTLGKPFYLGEFGLEDKSTRNTVYKTWTDALFNGDAAGGLYWILSAEQDNGTLYPDYDGFTVYCPSPVCTTLSNFASDMRSGVVQVHSPVADADQAVTMGGAEVALLPLENDIVYGTREFQLESIDLDPEAAGVQTELTVTGGVFRASAGVVIFTPVPEFAGVAEGLYTVTDSSGAVSNSAQLSVEVMPDPSAAVSLFSFENNSQGFGPASWTPDAGSVETSSDWASAGIKSLKLIPSYGTWFGATFPVPQDLSGKVQVKWDVRTTDNGTSQEFVLQTGNGWAWCQGSSWDWVNAQTETTLARNLAELDCGGGVLDLSQVHALYIYMGNGGSTPIYIDNIRAE